LRTEVVKGNVVIIFRSSPSQEPQKPDLSLNNGTSLQHLCSLGGGPDCNIEQALSLMLSGGQNPFLRGLMCFHPTSKKYLKILQQKVVEKKAAKQIKEAKAKKEKKKGKAEWQNHLMYNTTNNQKIG